LVTADDFEQVRTPLYEYLPEHHENKNFSERLTLRGGEVDALREIITKVDRKDLSFDAATLMDFVMYKMKDEPIHVDQSHRDSE
jgi:predicted nucleic acid-binding OB-fold protein